MVKKAFLRARQFARSVQARPLDPPEMAYLQTILTPAQLALFKAFPLYEQRHALNVCRTLTGAGFGYDRDLLQASLLHDLGKFDPVTGQSIPVWVKVANVVVGAIAGPLYRGWRERQSSAGPGHWRYYFWLQAVHEARGAALAQEAGGGPRVAALIGECKKLQLQGDKAALALGWADDLN
ncbi:MAG: hypothetical protein J0I20_15750 [Chloroflexi bacterium]|nr:hypothetical protein [Chloroflexota bacterium]OJV91247.1 MAG: hypothetical protein BGO39_26720 [Chloroflexi bacterium 54-19]